MAEKNSDRIGDYLNIPERSDRRGFSYKAPERFDYRDELKKPASFWSRLLAKLGGKERS